MAPIALITGGSSGLGFALAKELGIKGYSLLIIARDQQKIDGAVNELHDQGLNAEGYSCDITNEDQLVDLRNKLKSKQIKIDFLILNAGVVSCKLLKDYPNAKELKQDLEVDLWGTILSTYIFLPIVKDNCRILMISSAFGLIGPAVYSVYSAAKGGIINFAESIRRELLCRKISVHVACPSDIDTPQLHAEQKELPEWFKQKDRRKPMSAETAAKRIIKKCFKNKFLIIVNFEIFLLLLLNKFFPRRLRDFLTDKIFPLPNKHN